MVKTIFHSFLTNETNSIRHCRLELINSVWRIVTMEDLDFFLKNYHKE